MSVTREERDRLRKWCRDMDAADGLVRDESPICIWEELLDALDAADEAVQQLDWKSREWHEFDHGDIKKLQPYEACEECENQRKAVAVYREAVAPASADAAEAAP